MMTKGSSISSVYAVTHFKRDTFTLYEYAAVLFGTIEEAVKRVSKWAAAYFTHPNSYYKLPTSHAVSLPRIKIPKQGRSQTSEEDEASFQRRRREPLGGSGGMPPIKV